MVHIGGTQMVLMMSRPWKHPKTGVYWLRKRVPADLRPILCKAEEKRTLGTKDASEAKLRFAIALAELEQRWHNLRVESRPLSEREANDLAQHFYDTYLAANRENPSRHSSWDSAVGASCFSAALASNAWDIGPSAVKRVQMEIWCKDLASEHLQSKGIRTDEAGLLSMAQSVANALQAASLELERLAKGQFVSSPDLPQRVAQPAAGSDYRKPVTFQTLLDGWAAEKQPVEKTRYTFTKVLHQLEQHLGHERASDLTPEHLQEWKQALIASGLSPKTIKDSKFAPLRAVLQWGADNGHLSSNPAAKLTMSVKKRAGEGRRSYNDDEAKAVLAAARAASKPHLRWVPLLCAYTGARVAEICQLRRQDVVEVEGIACIRIAAEAGSIKTLGSERVVPLHPEVVNAGFLNFARDRSEGPLFTELKPDRFGSRGGNGTKVIGRWVRENGVSDPRISPSHSWRHRFKTLGRRHGLALDLVNAMTGHRSKNVADSYGEFEVGAMYRELVKLP